MVNFGRLTALYRTAEKITRFLRFNEYPLFRIFIIFAALSLYTIKSRLPNNTSGDGFTF